MVRHYSQLSNQGRSPVQRSSLRTREEAERELADEIMDMALDSDFVVLARYDLENREQAADYKIYNLETGEAEVQDIPQRPTSDGIFIWYFCQKDDPVFRCRKLLIELVDGCYASGQLANYEGYWEDFGQYVTEDRWVHGLPKNSSGLR